VGRKVADVFDVKEVEPPQSLLKTVDAATAASKSCLVVIHRSPAPPKSNKRYNRVTREMSGEMEAGRKRRVGGRERDNISRAMPCEEDQVKSRVQLINITLHIFQLWINRNIFLLTLIVKAHSHTPLHSERTCVQATPCTRATLSISRDLRANASDTERWDVQRGLI
jgi:hypothetical protein